VLDDCGLCVPRVCGSSN